LADDNKNTQAKDIKLARILARDLWETNMTKTLTTPYDTAEYLKTGEDMASYLEACFEEADDDSAFIAKTLGNIARARGMTQLARDTGLAREGLYKALSENGNPEFAMVMKVIKALGLKLHVEVGDH
jgi:probable addiction module antidote protein